MKKTFYPLACTLLIFSTLKCQVNETWSRLTGSAFLENRSYETFENICDMAGGRLLGSPGNEKAMEILKSELHDLGINAQMEHFKAPGWIRGNDQVQITSPLLRNIQALALGYVNSHPSFTAKVVFAGSGFKEDYSGVDIQGKIALVSSEAPKGKEPILRYEAINIAAELGAKAILFINEHPGMSNLAGTGNFQGTASPIPAYSLTYEEGMWIKRLAISGKNPEMKLTTNSYCREVETGNLVFSLPGKVKDKIVIGAHFDSWDIS
ncbi:MAG: hypothetical protein HF314_10785 [Ignavibacteria bacterium]|jgi:Iap family predicted aminopeptidase|nr:hypothetical protein [Ignavibacteria bacterium]MCU7503551.1 hypothetical protein [Ignavibacteria bacterium]MCU7516795.1 hypothetical protein [Ignavibacteria bacterium]